MVIRWKLALVMADRGISNKELAVATGLNQRSISRLKLRRQLTRVDQETLNALCKALSCQPGDLMSYEPDAP